jgi:putative Mn2+ efflux pump MntP
MGIIELLLTAVAFSMDAFAVAICKGLATGKARIKHMVIVGLWFGGFQALMPLIGYLLGSTFADYITPVDHWIAFALLSLLGVNMLKEAFSSGCEECEKTDASLSFHVMLTMAVATSIDALAGGISFALMPDFDIWLGITFIGILTFAFSAAGVKIGSVFGAKNKKYAELVGGVILILMGIKILLEDLGVINF